MNIVDLRTLSEGLDCFLPERKFLFTASVGIRNALETDQLDESRASIAVRQAIEQVDCDEDVCDATDVGMHADLSGTEAEELACMLKLLGAKSSAESLQGLRISYASCVRELHTAGHVTASEGLLVDLALQLVDPIKCLPSPTAALAALKIVAELLSFVGLEFDPFPITLGVRAFHPNSQIGGAKAVMGLIADHRASTESERSGRMSFDTLRKGQPSGRTRKSRAQTTRDLPPKSSSRQ